MKPKTENAGRVGGCGLSCFFFEVQVAQQELFGTKTRGVRQPVQSRVPRSMRDSVFLVFVE